MEYNLYSITWGFSESLAPADVQHLQFCADL